MAEINVHIASESELFDPYSADRDALNPGFVAFVQRQYDEKHDGSAPVLCIVSDVPVDEARVRTALQGYIAAGLSRNRAERRRNRWVELYLFLIGVACITAGILLTKAGTIYLQILSLTAGFAIKEAATIFFMKNPQNTLERARILFLSRSELKLHARVAPTPRVPTPRAALPERADVAGFVDRAGIRCGVQARYTDLVSEVGELGKEVLRATDCGRRPFSANADAALETGDCLFSLLALCDEMGVDPSQALDRALSKYEGRLASKGGPGSD